MDAHRRTEKVERHSAEWPINDASEMIQRQWDRRNLALVVATSAPGQEVIFVAWRPHTHCDQSDARTGSIELMLGSSISV